jgi:hypothetical protein
MDDRRRLNRQAARAFRLAFYCGVLVLLVGGLLLVGSWAHFERGNLLAGLVIVVLACGWMLSAGAGLAWRRQRLRSPRRSDWEERRHDTAIH